MTAKTSTMMFGWRVYGLGVMALGIVCLVWGNFDPGQPVPTNFPGRAALAYGTGAFMLVAGGAIQWRRLAVWSAAVLAGYFGLIVFFLMHGRVLISKYAEYGTYSGAAEQLAIAASALVVYAANARIEPRLAAHIARLGQVTFGSCALLFGGAHFFYVKLTAPLVPAWLPPSREFWAYATGIGHIAGGLTILTRVQARVAAIMLTAMFASFTPLVHLPMLLADPSNHFVWSENALNVVLSGVSWVVADSLFQSQPEVRDGPTH